MSDGNDGGPAFPYVGDQRLDHYSDGMSLRDYFAAKAMQARINNLGFHYHANEMGVEQCLAETARRAYQMANAMLAERDK